MVGTMPSRGQVPALTATLRGLMRAHNQQQESIFVPKPSCNPRKAILPDVAPKSYLYNSQIGEGGQGSGTGVE